MHKDRLSLVALHFIGISQRKLRDIFVDNKNYTLFFETLSWELLSKYHIDEKTKEKILKNYENCSLEGLEKLLNEREVKIITLYDEEYPENLKNIANPPYMIYVRGNLGKEPKIAMIGSRQITSYGKKAIEQILPKIAPYFTIVSGGAFGCDAEAHKQSIFHKAKTIAVIGTGIDIDYPKEHEKLYHDIVQSGGAIVSIFPLKEPGNPYNFPIRNEILSALSEGVVVIEAGEKSGTLITAQLALDQWRDLFSLPWDIFKTNSLGCNNLIKKWEAKMMTCATDILEEYNLSLGREETKKQVSFQNELEKKIYHCLIVESLWLDEIARRFALWVSDVSVTTSYMEIRGLIKKIENGKYEVC